jgi:hypothetical protein
MMSPVIKQASHAEVASYGNNKMMLKYGHVDPISKVGIGVRTFGLCKFPGETDGDGDIVRVANAKAFDLPLGHPLDVSWLKSASETYKISSDYRDYIVCEVPIVTANVPNRNMDAFSYKELTYYSPLYGCMTYQTFKGKPTHINHDNRDPTKAKGVIFDASLRKIGGVYHVHVALGFDRTKDADLVQEIIASPVNGFSMGALVSYTTCSICGFKSNGRVYCDEHIGFKGSKKGSIFDNRIAFEYCNLCNYIETSRVGSPADINAVSEEKVFLG